jgi:ribosome maturation factor RimP
VIKCFVKQDADKFGANTYFPLLLQWKKIKRRERSRSLLLLSAMNIEEQIKSLEQKVENLIRQEPGVFLVEIRIRPTNNVKVFLDADQGVNIDKLVQYNRKLYRDLEETAFFPGGDFSLEISSPGIGEPLKLHRQYVKNIGRLVEVIQKDGIKREGKLSSVDENEIIVEEERGKGKKKEIIQHTIPLSEIKSIVVQVSF